MVCIKSLVRRQYWIRRSNARVKYPVDIIFETEEGESVTTLNSEEEMWSVKEDCQEEWKSESVFLLCIL